MIRNINENQSLNLGGWLYEFICITFTYGFYQKYKFCFMIKATIFAAKITTTYEKNYNCQR